MIVLAAAVILLGVYPQLLYPVLDGGVRSILGLVSRRGGTMRSPTAALRQLFLRVFPRSLWVYHCNAGACNGCDIEVIDVLTPYYDAERFGIKLVASPRHADVLLIRGR